MCCKNSEKSCIHVQKYKKRELDQDFFHYIVLYYIYNIPIPYTFAVETGQGIT